MIHLKNSVLDTLHINLWGIPGSGKLEVATALHAALSRAGLEAELVQEYAKELGWSGDLARFDANGDMIEVDQMIISSEQYRRENLLHGVVQIAITAAPVLVGVLYSNEEDEENLRALLRRRTSGWRNLDILVIRDVKGLYGSRGRIKNRTEALEMAPRIKELLESERPNFSSVYFENSVEEILSMVAKISF